MINIVIFIEYAVYDRLKGILPVWKGLSSGSGIQDPQTDRNVEGGSCEVNQDPVGFRSMISLYGND